VSAPGAFAHNEEGQAGTYDLRTGLWASVNTFFVKLEQQTGLCRPAQIAAAMGVRRADGRPLQQVPSMTLGTNEIAPLDMAEAYASFAAHGLHCESRAILSIVDVETKKKIKVPPARCGQAIDPKIADGVTAILHGVIDGSYSGRTGAREGIGRPAAGKTGTTDGHVNVWFIGFVPQLAAAVWVGAPSGSSSVPIWSMNSVTIGGHHYSPAFGNNLPGPVWKDVMSYLTKDLPVRDFAPVDPSVVRGFTIQVPQVAGLSAADALRKLQQAGFQAQLSPDGKPSKFAVGTVAYTSPPGGSFVGSGTAITVFLSTGPAKPPPSSSPSPSLGPTISPTVKPPG
jgi:membrane peptidoglycan carboxypeptidase